MPRRRGLRKITYVKTYDHQKLEIQAYKSFVRQINPSIWNHLPEFYGTVRTDFGIGIVTRLFRNHDGTFPDNLALLLSRGMSAELTDALEVFMTWMKSETVITYDLLPQNVIAITRQDGSHHLVLVDGFGNLERIPFSNWFRLMGRKVVRRQLIHFQKHVDKMCSAH